MNTSTTSPQRVFISYRREDSAAYAGRLYDSMVARFGEDNVFMDVEMEPGIDFVERINEVVSSCAALIVVIGPRWATIEGEDGNPRLHDETDFVRQEVTAACRRADVTVIPALVGKAQMPRAEQLPDDLRPLARRNALELSDGRWRYDVGRLTSTLDTLLDGYTGFGTKRPGEPLTPGPQTPIPPPAPVKASALTVSPAQLLVEGVSLAAVSAFVGRLLIGDAKMITGGEATTVNPVFRQTVTWALVGLVLALWMGWRAGRTNFVRLGLLGLFVGALAGTVGAGVWAAGVDPPVGESAAAEEASENWTVANFAVTGALVGALLGALYPRPRVFAALLGGLVAGAVVQAIVNTAGWNTTEMPGLAFVFGLRGAAIAAGGLGAMVLLDRREPAAATARSSAAARAPAPR